MSTVLQRLPNSRFSVVLPAWRDEAVVLIGGGTSLSMDDVELARQAHAAGELRCVAVNDAYLIAPWADVHYAADSKWHRWHTQGVAKPKLDLTAEEVRAQWAAFEGQKCTIQNSGANVDDDNVHMLRNKTFPDHSVGLSLDPQALITGRNSGFQAFNLSTLAGGTTIFLLGYDGRPSVDSQESHWHGGHPTAMPILVYPEFRKSFSAAEHDLKQAGVRVINCSMMSVIASFPKKPFSAALARLAGVC